MTTKPSQEARYWLTEKAYDVLEQIDAQPTEGDR